MSLEKAQPQWPLFVCCVGSHYDCVPSSQQLYHLHSFKTETLGQKQLQKAESFNTIREVCLRSPLIYTLVFFGAYCGGHYRCFRFLHF